jgi:thiol-disulfide isomerase/thioredoxin
MKNTAYILLMLFFTVVSCQSGQKNNTVEIKGSLEDIQDSKATLLIGNTRIPVEISNGSFYINTEVSDTEVTRLLIDDKKLYKTVPGGGYIPVKSMSIWLVVYPGAKINISGTISDFADAYPSDGGENDLLAAFNRQLFPLLNKSANIEIELYSDTAESLKRTSLEEEQEALDARAGELRKIFLDEHISSVAGLWLLDDMVIRSQIEMDEVERLLKKVKPVYASNQYYVSLATRLKGYLTTKTGMTAPDIVSSATPDSSLFRLSDLRGKYVLMDFWGTWCGACVAGMPAMKEFRDRHADVLQIVGLAQDRDYAKWKSFVESREMNWPNVLVGKGDQNFVLLYNVQGFPTKILLDPQGKILLRVTGENEEFYQEVEKLIVSDKDR